MAAFEFAQHVPDLFGVVIEGRRIKLVPISAKYEQAIFESFTHQVTRYMFPMPAADIGETRAFIEDSRASTEAANNLQLVILNKLSEEFLGCCGLHGEANPRIPEFGIWLKQSAHGQGLGREAIHCLYNWARQTMSVDYFIYPVDRRNTASRRIPESLGGVVIEEYVSKGLAGNELDTLVYKISASSSLP